MIWSNNATTITNSICPNIATKPIVAPTPKEPVSPAKIFAGYLLNNQNAVRTEIIVNDTNRR